MTDNMKKLMEKVSADETLKAKLEELSEQAGEDAGKGKELVTAFAAEQGIVLTDEDFDADDPELSEGELEAVAGGAACVCVIGGGGSGDHHSCACGFMGTGGDNGCYCVGGGGGSVD